MYKCTEASFQLNKKCELNAVGLVLRSVFFYTISALKNVHNNINLYFSAFLFFLLCLFAFVGNKSFTFSFLRHPLANLKHNIFLLSLSVVQCSLQFVYLFCSITQTATFWTLSCLVFTQPKMDSAVGGGARGLIVIKEADMHLMSSQD